MPEEIIAKNSLNGCNQIQWSQYYRPTISLKREYVQATGPGPLLKLNIIISYMIYKSFNKYTDR